MNNTNDQLFSRGNTKLQNILSAACYADIPSMNNFSVWDTLALLESLTKPPSNNETANTIIVPQLVDNGILQALIDILDEPLAFVLLEDFDEQARSPVGLLRQLRSIECLISIVGCHLVTC